MELKFSVVTTVLNERKTIRQLLKSLVEQSLSPNEIIIVDAGSSDGTTEIISKFKESHRTLRTVVAVESQVNRSRGRNLAILRARNEHIAVIDAGCAADGRWLETLAQPFLTNAGTEAVAGFYTVKPGSGWERSFALYMATMPDQLDKQSYLPSSRSVAFTKQAWKKADGYPEILDTCEDLVFASRLKQKTRMVVEPKALVRWQLPQTLGQFFRQIKNYARGDMEAGYMPHVLKIGSVWLRYGLFLVIPLLFPVYWVYPLVKFKRYIKSLADAAYVPLTQLTADMAVMVGSIEGLVHRINRIGQSKSGRD